MDLRQLEYVIAVVDEGGFTRAARSVHVSQPALSQAVRSLERDLGVELFNRSGRTVALTSAGEALLGPARQALRDARSAREAIDEVKGLTAGRLDLVCLATLAVDPVAGLVGAFRRRHPGVRVRIEEPGDAGAALTAVRDGSAEIAVTDLGDDLSGLLSIEMSTQEMVVLVPDSLMDGLSSAATTSGSIDLAALADLPIVAPPPGTSVRRLLDETLAGIGRYPDVVVETAHRETIGPLVRAGAGAAVLPAGMEPAAIGVDGSVRVLALDPPIRRRVGAVHRDAALSPAARSFLEVLHGSSATHVPG